jgi:hypothetical protein
MWKAQNYATYLEMTSYFAGYDYDYNHDLIDFVFSQLFIQYSPKWPYYIYRIKSYCGVFGGTFGCILAFSEGSTKLENIPLSLFLSDIL